MDELLELLEECCPGVDVERETALMDDEILTSLDVVSLVMALNDHYGIAITVEDLTPENFNSAQGIYALVQRLLDE